MTKELLQTIAELYRQGGNIQQYLKSQHPEMSRSEVILLSYDFQAGSYIQYAEQHRDRVQQRAVAIAKVLTALIGETDKRMLEVGVGEGITLCNVLNYLPKEKLSALQPYGFDISWSRVRYARLYAERKGYPHCVFFTGDLFTPPLQPSSFEIVYTFHSIEPNGGREKEALEALYALTRKYLVLFEPIYEFGNEAAKRRMERLGYVKGLYTTAVELGYEVVEYRLFEHIENPLNPTGVLIIRRPDQDSQCEDSRSGPLWRCPLTYTPLQKIRGVYYSKEAFLAYPIVDSIPCLLPQNAILATHFLDFNDAG